MCIGSNNRSMVITTAVQKISKRQNLYGDLVASNVRLTLEYAPAQWSPLSQSGYKQ